LPNRDPESTMTGRGRKAMMAQFKTFYRSEFARIHELDAHKDIWILMNLFTNWLRRRSADMVPELPEAAVNILLSRAMKGWDEFLEVVNMTAEAMVFENFQPGVSPFHTNPLPESAAADSTVPPVGGIAKGGWKA